jgi:hypothetical protein
VLVVEHKTSSEDVTPGSFYWSRLRMDGQVSVYFDGARALGTTSRAASTTCWQAGAPPGNVPLVDE